MVILVTNIHYLFTLVSGTSIEKMSSTSKFSHQHPQIVTNTVQYDFSSSFRTNNGTKTYQNSQTSIQVMFMVLNLVRNALSSKPPVSRLSGTKMTMAKSENSIAQLVQSAARSRWNAEDGICLAVGQLKRQPPPRHSWHPPSRPTAAWRARPPCTTGGTPPAPGPSGAAAPPPEVATAA